jgi:catechol 2,3-dioxygenase-like lactoylglutathione lyase family enzyme
MRGDHAGLRVPDFDAAVAWHQEKLDFRLTATAEAVGLKWPLLAPAADDSFQIESAGGPGAEERLGSGNLIKSLAGAVGIMFASVSTTWKVRWRNLHATGSRSSPGVLNMNP